MATKDFLLLILRSHGALVSHALEQFGLRAFMYGEFVSALVKELKELPPPSPSKPRSSVLKVNHQGHPTRTVGLGKLENGVRRIDMKYRVLYIPAARNFPLVDGFFFVDSPRKTLVGLQMTTAGEHHTIPSTVRLFKNNMAKYFKGWKKLSRDMSWEMIYVQRADSKRLKNGRDVVRQYQKFERRWKKRLWRSGTETYTNTSLC
ncbi:putative retrotransposon hot spot (RHS) protein [Trypanosoma cruzi]|uniref:Putative retrotransposon hot spot (RHS) protein n=1 Tax=Trypanosoma cruzi TaxID=5693 RepID=A0A2V2UUB5_TRYCR|nr:putative retrotransposon hot spot (RHS) protein [Trypanosoma cruzi]